MLDAEVSRTEVRNLCAAVENANPLYWDPAAARELVGTEIAPPSMLSAWGRPGPWSPGTRQQVRPLQLHFDLKQLFDFPTALVSGFAAVFHAPARIGERVRSVQILRSLSAEKTTRLGCGRFWTVEVEYRREDGEFLGSERFECFAYRALPGS